MATELGSGSLQSTSPCYLVSFLLTLTYAQEIWWYTHTVLKN